VKRPLVLLAAAAWLVSVALPTIDMGGLADVNNVRGHHN